jgi:probable H4MPT-linked C1 transfer pathway protein
MTAELADCFETKAAGVSFVIRALEQAFPEIPLRIWMTSGEFAEPADACDLPVLVAAANWNALATWAGRGVPSGPAILMDIGSTTTDIIPLLDGLPANQGSSDLQRLLHGELVYTGIGRTPVCAVVQTVPVHGRQCPIAAEVFATTADALVITGLLSEDEANLQTADHRPLTRFCSFNRMARMLCCDRTELSDQDLEAIAAWVVEQQQQQILRAFQLVWDSLEQTLQQDGDRSFSDEKPALILSGSGAMLGREVARAFGIERLSEQMYLPEMYRKPVAEAACAFAVARLAHDRCRDDLLELSLF